MNRPLDNERGTALIIAILFLMVLSMLIALLHRTALLEQFSGQSYQNTQKAFYAAENGIRRGLTWLGSQGGPPQDGLGTDAWFSPHALAAGETPVWSPAEAVDGCSDLYHIEFLKDEASLTAGNESAQIGKTSSTGARLHYYRITGKGISGGIPSRTLELQLVTTVIY